MIIHAETIISVESRGPTADRSRVGTKSAASVPKIMESAPTRHLEMIPQEREFAHRGGGERDRKTPLGTVGEGSQRLPAVVGRCPARLDARACQLSWFFGVFGWAIEKKRIG